MKLTVQYLTKCLPSYPWTSCQTQSESMKVDPKLGSGALGIFPLENYPKAKEPLSIINQS